MGCTKENPEGYDFTQHEPDLMPHKHNDMWLFCTLTRKQVDKTIDAVTKHIKGKKFLKAKAAQPERPGDEDEEGVADRYDQQAEFDDEQMAAAAEGDEGLEEESEEGEGEGRDILERFPFLDQDASLAPAGKQATKRAKNNKAQNKKQEERAQKKAAPTEEDEFAAYIAQHGQVKKEKEKIPPPAPKRKRGDGKGGGNNAPGSGKKNKATALKNSFKKKKAE